MKAARPSFVEFGDGRGDDGSLLIPESPVFPGMGIQPADGDVGRCDPAFPQEIGSQFPDAENRFGREQPRDIGERTMDRREADGEGRPGEEHPEIRASRRRPRRIPSGREKGIRRPADPSLETGPVTTAAASVSRSSRTDSSSASSADSGGFAGRLAGHACEPVPDHAEIEALRQLPRGKRRIHDFRADPGRIAEGDEDFRHGLQMEVERRACKLEASPRC